MQLHKIRLELELDEPSGVYTVTSPDVPELITEGSTPEEIQRNVQAAIEGLIDAAKRHNFELPPALQAATPSHLSAETLILA